MDYPTPDSRECTICGHDFAVYHDMNPHDTKCFDCRKKLREAKRDKKLRESERVRE